DEVAGARDRQELGESLDDPHHGGLDEQDQVQGESSIATRKRAMLAGGSRTFLALGTRRTGSGRQGALFCSMSPGLGHPASTSSFTSAKQGALPSRSHRATRTAVACASLRARAAGGRFPEVEEEV